LNFLFIFIKIIWYFIIERFIFNKSTDNGYGYEYFIPIIILLFRENNCTPPSHPPPPRSPLPFVFFRISLLKSHSCVSFSGIYILCMPTNNIVVETQIYKFFYYIFFWIANKYINYFRTEKVQLLLVLLLLLQFKT
jgi:hypothetical protein